MEEDKKLSLQTKLLLVIGTILLATQLISAFWVWHESQEQISILVDQTLAEKNRNAKIEHELDEVVVALLLPSMFTVILSLVIISIAIKKITHPLNLLTKELDLRSVYNLTPLNEEQTTLEMALITQKINELFSRIDMGIKNERRFTSDVAHELRTPLAGVRVNLELLKEKTPEIPLLLAKIDQMIISVEQLLQLARAGQTLLNEEKSTIDLIRDVVEPMQFQIEDDGFSVPIEWQTPSELFMKGDAGLLFVLLRNLLENAARYAPDSKKIIVRIVEEEKFTQLEVIDEGTGVSEAQVIHLTERFTRLDENKNGYGLGLNIVDRIVRIHQGELSFKNRTDPKGFIVIVKFYK